jgi:hypothetical protein
MKHKSSITEKLLDNFADAMRQLLYRRCLATIERIEKPVQSTTTPEHYEILQRCYQPFRVIMFGGNVQAYLHMDSKNVSVKYYVDGKVFRLEKYELADPKCDPDIIAENIAKHIERKILIK